MKFKMVHLRMSATEKFSEAVYFCNCLIETRNNVHTFPFNLSAFLSAARSVTFYLQEQFEADPVFREWYAERQSEMRGEPLLRMLKDMRDEALHARPIEMWVWSGPRLPEEGIVTDRFEWSLDNDVAGNIRVQCRIGKDGPETDAVPVTRWVFDQADETEVLEVCANGLEKLRTLLQQWEKKRQQGTAPVEGKTAQE